MKAKKHAVKSKDHLTSAGNAPPGNHQSILFHLENIIRSNNVAIMIFLASFFFILTIANPGLFLNDEWITANQLHQIDIGHQPIVNEGKYGTYQNGTPSVYFEARHNLLGYTLMYPLLSLPAAKIFGLFGDHFRAFILLIWAVIPVILALMVRAYYPEYTRIFGIPWTYPVIALSFMLYFINLMLYSAFPLTPADAPYEVAALVFTNHILFAATVVVIYYLCRTIFGAMRGDETERTSEEMQWKVLFGTVACIFCSSYAFWSTNAKDHMLEVFLFSLVLLFFIRFATSRSVKDLFPGFACIGLLAWVRPEFAFSVLIFGIIATIGVNLLDHLRGDASIRTLATHILCIPATLIGAIPFFLNNLYVTGSPFIPSFYIYNRPGLVQASASSAGGAATSAVSTTSAVQAAHSSGTFDVFFNLVGSRFGHLSPSLFHDIVQVFFAPESGHISVIAVCPLLFLALLLIPVLLVAWKKDFSKEEKSILLFLGLFSLSVIFGYITSFHMMSTDGGIVPDMRYISPIYLPAALLGLMAITSVIYGGYKKWTLYTLMGAGLLTPALIILMILIRPYGGFYSGMTHFLMNLIYLALGATTVLALLTLREKKWEQYLMIALALLIILPFVWQMMMVVLYSVAKFNGYPFWVPAVDALYNQVIQYNIVE